MTDRHQALREVLERSVLTGPDAVTPAAERTAAAQAPASLPAPVGVYCAQVAAAATGVDAAMIDAARASGRREAEVFELTAAAAVGAARRQLAAAHAAIAAADARRGGGKP